MPKNKNVINKLKRGLNMVEPDMDELNIRNLIQKKKNKDIKIRAKMKNEKKHLKYNPQIIESNMNDNDENENDENEEELTFEQKMDLHNKYCKLVFKIDRLTSRKKTIETASKYFGESAKDDDYYKIIDDIKKYMKKR